MLKCECVGKDLYVLEWLSEYLKGHSGFIAGGCYKNIFREEKIKDIDIFFYNETEFKKGLDVFHINCFRYFKVYENDRAVGFRDKQKGVAIDLIRKTYGTPQQVIDKFDFTITKMALYMDNKYDTCLEGEVWKMYVCYHPEFFKHLQLRMLEVEGNLLYPVSTFERMIRYVEYGYFPSKECKRIIINNLRDDTRPLDDLSNTKDNWGSGNNFDDIKEGDIF
jgi:hypothetical protein